MKEISGRIIGCEGSVRHVPLVQKWAGESIE